MRKCLRCEETMIEDYMLKTENLTAQASVLLAKGGGLLSSHTKGKVKAAVCPQCGEISIYFENVHKLK